MPERDILTGAGALNLKQPRVREPENQIYRMLKRPSAILGDGVKGLSPANIVRLKKGWEDDYKEWSGRDLSNKE